MADPVIPTPRRYVRQPMPSAPSALSVLGEALSTIGKAGADYEAQRRATDERVEEIDQRIFLQEQRRQDDALYLEKAQEWVAADARARQRVAEARQEGSYRDHPERVQKIIDEEFRAFDESLAGNDRVRERFRLGIVQSAAQIDATEQGWARQAGFKAQGEALETVVTTRRNQLSRVDPAQMGEQVAMAIAEADAMIDAAAYSDEDAAVMKRMVRTEYGLGAKEGLFNAGQPQMVQALLEQGFFDGLDLDTSKLGEQVAAEQRALDIAAEQAQAEAQRAAREQADAIEAKIKLGINPTQAEFDAAAAAMVQAGVPEDERIAFGGLSVQIGLNRQYSEAADPDGIAAANAASALGRKVASGTASEAEQVAYAHLSGVAEARAKAAGAKRKELAGQGVQGQMAVLADLDRMPFEQRFTAAEAARSGLGYVAGLPQQSREFALSGREVRTARPKDFGTKEEVAATFRTATGELAASLGGSYDQLMNLAWDLYAGGISSEGRDGWDARRFEQSVNVAFGSTRRSDGTRQGGLGDFNGTTVWLPSNKSEQEFERFVRSRTFAEAVYADGSKASKADVLANYRPEYYRDYLGMPVYRMIDASGKPLMQKNGRPYDFGVPVDPLGAR